MTDAADPVQSFDRLRRHAITSLMPFFADSPDSDPATARVVAEGLLDGYNAVTPKELQLATQIIALGWAAMACLRAAAAAKDLTVDETLSLQDSAIALDRSSQKATKALEARRKERAKRPKVMSSENLRWEEGAFQLVLNQAHEKLTDANLRLATHTAASPTASGPATAVPAVPEPPERQTRRFRFSDPTKPSLLARRGRK
jgi:hypothetical protein